MGDFDVCYFLYLPKFVYCLAAFHGGLQPCTHGSLCVVLMGLGIPEVDQDPVAHELRYEAAEATHGLGDALLIGRNETSRRSSGSMRAENAVEPTKSENITVT
jgi:hypothetical protein